MLFVYECTGNIIADFKKFYDTQLSEQDKKKIFIPTYDCMKRYQGSWHVEQKPLFTDCFFIECRNKEELKTTLSRQHCSDSLAEAVMSGITPLRPEQEEFLKELQIEVSENSTELLKNEKMLETTEKVVYSCLDLFPRNVSEIQMKTGLDARILMETLMTLEMEGYIKETAKNYYVRMSDVR